MDSLVPGQSVGGRAADGPTKIVRQLLAEGVGVWTIREGLSARGYSSLRIGQIMTAAAKPCKHEAPSESVQFGIDSAASSSPGGVGEADVAIQIADNAPKRRLSSQESLPRSKVWKAGAFSDELAQATDGRIDVDGESQAEGAVAPVPDCGRPLAQRCLVVGGCAQHKAFYAFVCSRRHSIGLNSPPAPWVGGADDDVVEVVLPPPAAGPLSDEDRRKVIVYNKGLLLKPHLREKKIPGDGHCCFSSIMVQTPAGQGQHGWLRAEVVAEVRRHPREYGSFFIVGERAGWLRRMGAGDWGENIALKAAADLLKRPIMIWRVGTNQEPTIIINKDFDAAPGAEPIYLLLDESGGPQHYTALLGPDAPAAALPIDGRWLARAI